MEKIWNYIYYFIFILECKTTYLSQKSIKKLFFFITKCFNNFLIKKKSSLDELNKLSAEVLNNPKSGKSIDIAGIHIGWIVDLT